MSDKRQLRTTILGARRAMPTAERAAADRAIVAAATRLVSGLTTVAAYAPMSSEPGGPDLVPALAQAVPNLLLPIVLPDLDLDWAHYRPGAPMRQVRALAEPTGPPLGPNAITAADLVFVPAVAVDRRGNRLGRGGGSYDRALARLAPGTPVLALLYDPEWCDHLPAEPHDRPVTGVLTPSGRRDCRPDQTTTH